jgi:hypothetical protein
MPHGSLTDWLGVKRPQRLTLARHHTLATSGEKMPTPPALDGVTVLDATQILAGPFATMHMSDMGANIIKVEKPGGGDDTRRIGPPFINGESAAFL